MAKYILERSAQAWWLIDTESDPPDNRELIGYLRDHPKLLKDGPEVLITSDTPGCPKSRIIPSDTIVKGFGYGMFKNGCTLSQITDSGCIYNSALRLMA